MTLSFKWNNCIFEMSDNAYRISNLPLKFRDSSYHFSKDKNPAKSLFDFVKDFHNCKGRCFFFSGPPDIGKTTVAACAIKQLIAAKRGWGFYVSFVDILDHKIRDTKLSPEQPETFWGECFDTDFLILDDVGFEDFNAQTASNIILRIFRAREAELKSTILITQLNPKDFAGKYGKSLVSNITSRAETFIFRSGQ
jgi:DNA replication protein DnaC